VFGSIFRRGGEGRGGEQNTSKSQFLLSPKLGGFGGEGREAFINFIKLSKLSSLYFHIPILSLLQFLLLY
jgi:hypothetical protein